MKMAISTNEINKIIKPYFKMNLTRYKNLITHTLLLCKMVIIVSWSLTPILFSLLHLRRYSDDWNFNLHFFIKHSSGKNKTLAVRLS